MKNYQFHVKFRKFPRCVFVTGDQESNDSSLSSVSIGGPLPQAQAQPVVSNSGINENFQVPLAASGLYFVNIQLKK